jgi:hypothetical protein
MTARRFLETRFGGRPMGGGRVLHRPGGRGGGGSLDTSPRILLSAESISEGAADNSVVGALSVRNPEGTYVYTILSDPDNKFAISGSNLIIDELLDYEVAATHLVTVEANPDVGATITRTFIITVLNVFEAATLAALTLSTSTIGVGSAQGVVVGTLLGVAGGSTRSLIDTNGGQFQIDGANIEVGATALTLGVKSITVRETLADSSNSPRDSVIAITVVEAVAPDAPTITLTSGASDLTPNFDLIASINLAEDDILRFYDQTLGLLASHTVTALEAGGAAIYLDIPALSAGDYDFYATHARGGGESGASNVESITLTASGGTAGQPIGLLLALTKAA